MLKLGTSWSDHRKFRQIKNKIWPQLTILELGEKEDKQENKRQKTKYTQDLLPLVLPFNKLSTRLITEWKRILRENKFFKNMHLVAAYSNSKNLNDFLITTKLSL